MKKLVKAFLIFMWLLFSATHVEGQTKTIRGIIYDHYTNGHIQNVRVSLNDGKAYLELSEKNSLSLSQIQNEVKKNGFSAKKAEVVVEGTLININGGIELETGTETYIIDTSISDDLNSKLKPGIIKLKGIVQDEEDGNLSNTWRIKLTEIL